MTLPLHESTKDYEIEYQQVRAAFISRGTSLNAWLISQNINRQLAYQALKGRSFGRKALQLRRIILDEALTVVSR